MAPPGIHPPPPGARPPPFPPPFAPPSTDSFASSTTSSSNTNALSGTSSTSTGDLFGAGKAKLQGVMALLRTNPAFGHAGMALGYVLNNVASKNKADLTDTDKGAIKQAIIQMQALVGQRAVNPAQARILNGAIWQLQGALT